MSRIRPELIRGTALLTIFLALIISNSFLFPYPIKRSEYHHVSIDAIMLNPSLFEGSKISTEIVILSLSSSNTTYFATTEDGVNATFSSGLELPPIGTRILIRGVSWIETNNTISVDEYYAMDYSSSIIRSIPGIILFVILFFSVFRIDFKQLAFVKRSEEHA